VCCAQQQEDAVGILSLLLWSLTLVVTVQFAGIVLSLDHNGEGGDIALASQIEESNAYGWVKQAALYASIVGTGFVIGDGCLTPAISVVSAVEGLQSYSESLAPYVVPISCIILVLLFLAQRFGTAKVGVLFGPLVSCACGWMTDR
jgi:KUP system potassium uptake protein